MERRHSVLSPPGEVLAAIEEAGRLGCPLALDEAGAVRFGGKVALLPEALFRVLRCNGCTVRHLLGGNPPDRRRRRPWAKLDHLALSVCCGEWDGGEASELRALLLALRGKRSREARAARDILQHALLRRDEAEVER